MFKKFTLLSLAVIFAIGAAVAQIGIGTNSPNPAAQLDVSSTNKGLLIPRIALTADNLWAPLTGTPTEGMMIYNTATSGTGSHIVIPGFYYWHSSIWAPVAQTAGAAPTGTATFTCGAASPSISLAIPSGFVNGSTYSGYVTVPYTNGDGGSYPADGQIINGLSLTRNAGTLANGAGQIIYSLSGTYTGTAGSESFLMNLPGNSCLVTLPANNILQASSLNCQAGTAPAGSYETGVALTAANTKTITVTPSNPGPYNISTNTASGITFTASGSFTAAQVGTLQNIVMAASGTPASAGIKTFVISVGTQVCSFNLTVTSAAVFNCSSIINTTTQNSLVNGNSYVGSVLLPYTSGNGSIYTGTTVTSNGLSLTRVPGSYNAGGGNVLYNLSGIYSGTGTLVSFTLPESNCIVYTGSAPYNPGSLNCGGSQAGTYAYGTAMTAANTKSVIFSAGATGPYSVSTNTVNGVSFSGSGFINTAGVNTTVPMTASGTPAAAGIYTYTVNLGGQNCTFNITFNAPATFTCGSIVNTLPTPLVNGTPYSASLVETYTAGNNAAYPVVSIGPIDGLTLSAPAGTYLAAGGSINYTLSGTYTGASNGTDVFVLPESGCTVTAGAAILASINCSSGAQTGIYSVGIPMTAANTKAINLAVNAGGGYNISNTQNGVTFSGSGVLTPGNQTITLTASGTPITSGSFNYAVSIGAINCTFSISFTAPSTVICNSTTNSITGPLVTNSGYSGTITVPYIAGNGTNYSNFILGPTNGLTLTRVAGTYSPTGGNIIYNISGTYTGVTNATQSFVLAEGCTVILGQPDLVPGSLSCSGPLTGTYQVGISAAGNTKTIAFASTTLGNYTISSSNVGGITFSGNTNLTTTGSQTVVLNANGTPGNFGTFTCTITIDGQSCSFPVTIAPPVVVSCGSIVSQLPTAPINGTAYTGTVTEPYTSGNNQAYGATVLSNGGLTLTRVAGTYAAAGGNVVYNIGGTYTNNTNGYFFSLPENNCVLALQATAVAGSLNCSTPANGSYVVGVPMAGNNKPVFLNINTGGQVIFSTNTVNGISFSASTSAANGASFGLNMGATGTPLATGTFNYILTAGGQTCSFPITFTSPVTFNCNNISTTLSGPLINGTAYNFTITAPYSGGSGGTYGSTVTGPISGLTLTSVPGTYATGSGNVVYNVTGTYTGPSNNSISVTLPESGCTLSLGNALFTAGSLNCSGSLSGTYQNGVAVTAANTKAITVDVSAAGAYSISTTSSLGISFSASGVFSSTGTQTITLVASGTVNGTGTANFTVTAGNQTCVFPVTSIPPATINCSGITHNLPASLVNGTIYNTSTVTVPYTAGNGTTYLTGTVVSNGLTLTRVAGTYSPAGGNIVYNLSGTYTGTSGASVNFTLLDGGCVVVAGPAVYTAGSISCNGTLAGNLVQNVAMNAANTKAISISVTNPGPWSINTGAVNGVTFSGSGLFAGTNTQTAVITGSGTPTATGTFSYPVTLAGQSCNFSVTYSNLAANCGGIINALPTYLTNGATYNISGAVTLPYTAGNGFPYTTTTVTSQGLTLTRVPGTYASSGGNIVYNLSGTYSGGAGTTVTFTLPDGCSVTGGNSSFTSPNCSGATTGTYQVGVALTAANTKSVDLNFTAPGAYNISSSFVNGVSFFNNGSFATSGIHTLIMTGSGTPAATGTFIYTVTAGGQTCTFPVTFDVPATFSCGQITGIPNLLINSGGVYSGTISEPYTAGNNSAYGTTVLTSTGLSLTRTAGTFAPAGGNVLYTLSGTANASGAGIAYTLPESGCIVALGSPSYLTGSFSCGGQLSGTYIAGTNSTVANTKAVSVNVTVPGAYAITSTTANGITFAASGSTTTTGVQDIILTATGIPSAPGSYNYQVTLGGQTCSFAVNFQ